MSEQKRTGNMSASQKTELINLLDKNPQLRSGKFTQTFTFKSSQELWISIASSSNSLPGAHKTWQQWRKAWHDIKVSTKRKSAAIKKHSRATGGGPPLPNDGLLNQQEIQVANMMGPVAIEGHCIAEPSAAFDFVQPSTSFTNEFSDDSIAVNVNEVVLENEETSDHLYCESEIMVNKENEVPAKPKHSTKKLVQVKRLDHSINATEKMAQQNETRINQKGLYETKKLELYEKDIEVKKRIASALEDIAKKM